MYFNLFCFYSVAGFQGLSLVFFVALNYVENIFVFGILDSGGFYLLLKEERIEELVLCLGLYDLDLKKIGVRFDEIFVKDDLKLFDMNKYFGFFNFGVNLRKEFIFGNSKGKVLVDVEICKFLEYLGNFLQEISNQFLFKNLYVEVFFVVRDIIGVEKLKKERYVYLID